MSAARRPTARAVERRRLRAAALAVVIVALAAYAATIRELPFQHHFTLRGQFSTANQLHAGDAVRRAGVNIGKVTAIRPGPNHTSIVEMRIDDHQDLHANASLSIKPRLLFEGNFYIDVHPGTPAAPPLDDGTTIALAHTSVPVQIDQVLSSLSAPVRTALTDSVRAIGHGLGGGPGAPAGAAGLQAAARQLDGALLSVQRAARGLHGTRPGDLHRAVGSAGDFTGELAQDPAALAGVVSDFNHVAGALSTDQAALSSSVRSFDTVLRVAPANLTALDGALPVLTTFSDRLRPALRAAPASLTATTGLLRQIRLLGRAPELPALVRAIRPVTANLPSLEPQLATGLSLVDHAASCLNQTVLPALNTKIPDGANSTNRPIWQDILHLGSNILGASAGFDGNGGTLRLGLSEGANAMQEHLPGIGEVIGYGKFEGVNPVWLGANATLDYRPDVWCETQEVPNYGARSRIGLPPNLQVTRAHQETPAEERLAATVFRLYTGDKSDRHELLKLLLDRIPGLDQVVASLGKQTTAPTKPGASKPPAAPTAEPKLPEPAPAPAKPVPVPALSAPVQQVGSAVGNVLQHLLGGRKP